MTLLLLRYNHIPLHQSSNFIWSLLNHPGLRTILFSIIACVLSFTITGADTSDISVSVCLYSSEASFSIHKDLSHSDNTSILSIFLELVLALLYSLHYIYLVCHPAVTCLVSFMEYSTTSLLQGELVMLYQMLQP